MSVAALLAALIAPGCRTSRPASTVEVATWGTLREVLREGRTAARVDPARVVGPRTVGVGALAALAGEITVIDGRVLVATATRTAPGEAPAGCVVRVAEAGDQATLLVLADVPAWEEHELPASATYADLEHAIAAVLRGRGHDLTRPVPVRVRGDARSLAMHVIAGSCPFANPNGPAPWRSSDAAGPVELVGVFVEGATGRLTHHARRSHLHAVAGEVMGHLDEIALERAILLLPAE